MVRFSFTPYHCRLTSPLRAGHQVITERSGFLIALRSQDGIVGIGEVAPLPKFGTETLEEAERWLRHLSNALHFPEVPDRVDRIPAWLSDNGVSCHVTPAVSAALECAGLSIISRREAVPLPSLLCSGAGNSVPANGLISGAGDDEILEQSSRAFTRGANTLKVKVGARTPVEDATVLRKLRARFPQAVLRSDANGSWTYDQADEFCSGVSAVDMHYLEDPLAHSHPLTLKKLFDKHGVPFALDDSMRDDVWRQARIANRVYRVLIIKPSVFGMTTRSPGLINQAAGVDMSIVVTSLLETSVGLAYVSAFASAFGTGDLAQGVDTAALLGEDTVVDPLRSSEGRISVPDVTELHEQLRPQYRQALGI